MSSTIVDAAIGGSLWTGVAASAGSAVAFLLWWLNNKIEHRDRYLGGSLFACIIMSLGYASRATFIGGITRSGGIEVRDAHLSRVIDLTSSTCVLDNVRDAGGVLRPVGGSVGQVLRGALGSDVLFSLMQRAQFHDSNHKRSVIGAAFFFFATQGLVSSVFSNAAMGVLIAFSLCFGIGWWTTPVLFARHRYGHAAITIFSCTFSHSITCTAALIPCRHHHDHRRLDSRLGARLRVRTLFHRFVAIDASRSCYNLLNDLSYGSAGCGAVPLLTPM